MGTYLKLFFKSFYDRKFIKNYVEKEKGAGNSYLASLALFMAVIFTISIVLLRLTVTDELVSFATKPFFDQVKELHIVDGELQWGNNRIDKFDLNGDFKLTVDTTDANPSINTIRSSDIYMTKNEVYLNSENGKLQTIKYKDINSFTGQNDIVIDHEKFTKAAQVFMDYLFGTMIFFVFIFTIPVYWISYIVMAALTAVISANMNKGLQKFSAEANRRMAAVAITPPVLVFTLASYYFTAAPSLIYRWLLALAIGICLMLWYGKYILANTNKAKAVAPKAEAKTEANSATKAVAAKKPAAKKAPVKKAAAKKPAAKPAAKAKAPVKAKAAAKPKAKPAAKKATAKKTTVKSKAKVAVKKADK